MPDDEIKLSALEAEDLNESLSVSALDAGLFAGKRAIATTTSTQSKQAILSSDSIKMVRSDQEIEAQRLSAHDVAAFILEQQGEMTAMKLQKLVYYSQAWSLVWDDEPLFDEPIEAWANGPVIRALYARHQGSFKVNTWQGDPSKLTDSQRETILKVLEFYGPMAPQVLSDLTHSEEPWLKARAGLAVGDRGSRVISHSEMVEYYSSLV